MAMSAESDLVNRLRDRAYSGLPDPLLADAADYVARIRQRIAELEAWQAKARQDIRRMERAIIDLAALAGGRQCEPGESWAE